MEAETGVFTNGVEAFAGELEDGGQERQLLSNGRQFHSGGTPLSLVRKRFPVPLRELAENHAEVVDGGLEFLVDRDVPYHANKALHAVLVLGDGLRYVAEAAIVLAFRLGPQGEHFGQLEPLAYTVLGVVFLR